MNLHIKNKDLYEYKEDSGRRFFRLISGISPREMEEIYEDYYTHTKTEQIFVHPWVTNMLSMGCNNTRISFPVMFVAERKLNGQGKLSESVQLSKTGGQVFFLVSVEKALEIIDDGEFESVSNFWRENLTSDQIENGYFAFPADHPAIELV